MAENKEEESKQAGNHEEETKLEKCYQKSSFDIENFESKSLPKIMLWKVYPYVPLGSLGDLMIDLRSKSKQTIKECPDQRDVLLNILTEVGI